MTARKRIRIADADTARADLCSQPVSADHENVFRLWSTTLQVMRGRVPARDDVIEIAAKSQLLEAPQVVEPGRCRVVRSEEDVPLRTPQALQRLASVRQDVRAAVQNTVHVKDRDRHRREAIRS